MGKLIQILENFNLVDLGSQDQIHEIWNEEAKRDLIKLSAIIVSGEAAAPSPNENNCHFCDWRNKCKAVFKESEDALSLFSEMKVYILWENLTLFNLY